MGSSGLPLLLAYANWVSLVGGVDAQAALDRRHRASVLEPPSRCLFHDLQETHCNTFCQASLSGYISD